MAVQDGVIGNSRINVRSDPETRGRSAARIFNGAGRAALGHVSDLQQSRLELAGWIASAIR
jgi:hypothetical protein